MHDLVCAEDWPPISAGLGSNRVAQSDPTERESPRPATSPCTPDRSTQVEVASREDQHATAGSDSLSTSSPNLEQFTEQGTRVETIPESTRPQRAKRPPVHLKDYVYHAIDHPTSSPLHASSSSMSHPIS